MKLVLDNARIERIKRTIFRNTVIRTLFCQSLRYSTKNYLFYRTATLQRRYTSTCVFDYLISREIVVVFSQSHVAFGMCCVCRNDVKKTDHSVRSATVVQVTSGVAREGSGVHHLPHIQKLSLKMMIHDRYNSIKTHEGLYKHFPWRHRGLLSKRTMVNNQ